jgi:hypothetical protein
MMVMVATRILWNTVIYFSERVKLILRTHIIVYNCIVSFSVGVVLCYLLAVLYNAGRASDEAYKR